MDQVPTGRFRPSQDGSGPIERMRAPRDESGLHDEIRALSPVTRIRSTVPAGQIRGLRDESLAHQMDQSPTRRIRSPRDRSGAREMIKAPLDESRPHETYQCPAGRIRAHGIYQGPAERIRALRDESGSRGTTQGPWDGQAMSTSRRPAYAGTTTL